MTDENFNEPTDEEYAAILGMTMVEYDAYCVAMEEAAKEAELAYQEEHGHPSWMAYDESTNPSNGWRCPEPRR